VLSIDEGQRNLDTITNLISQLQQYKQTLLTNKRDAYGDGAPVTKTQFFKFSVAEKFKTKLIGMIAVAEEEVQHKPDSIDQCIRYTKAGVCIASIFIPYAGSAVGIAANTAGAGLEEVHDRYKKHKEKKLIKGILPDNGEELEVCDIGVVANIIVPKTSEVLTKRYEHPIKHFQGDAKSIKKLAHKAVKLMIISALAQRKDTPWKKGEEFYGDLAEFLCEGVSYFNKRADFFSKKKKDIFKSKSYKVLTRSGVQIPFFQDVPCYYVKSSSDIIGVNSEAEKKAYDKTLQYGFRYENKEAGNLRLLGYAPLKKEEWIEAVRKNQAEEIDNILVTKEKRPKTGHKVIKVIQHTGEGLAKVALDIAPEAVKMGTGA